MTFLSNFLGTKARDVQSAFTQVIVEFDPDTASEAQIKTVADALGQTNQRLAGLQVNVEAAQRAVKDDETAIHQRMDAAAILANQGKDDKAAGLLDEVEHTLQPKLDSDRQALADIQDTIKTYEGRRTELETKLRDARSRTDNARRDLERARLEKASAQDREQQARRDAGIDKSVSQLDIASTAMEKAAAKAHQEAAAARNQADSMSRVAPASAGGDPDVAAALAQASGKEPVAQKSVADRLAAMRANMGDKAA